MAGRFPILYLTEADPASAVLSSGLLARLVAEAPNAAVTVVGSPDSAPLFRDTPGLENLIVLPDESRLSWLRLWTQVRGRHWGLVVDLRGSKLSGHLKRQRRAVRDVQAQAMAEAEDGPQHAVISAAKVLLIEDDPPAPHLTFGPQTLAAVEEVMGSGDGPLLAIAPGVDWIGKQWPAERFTKVATHLLGPGGPLQGGRLLIVGTAEDRDAAHTIRFAVSRDRVIEAQGRLDPLQTACALSRADLVLAAESLWLQLAVASGAPTVAVFGPSDERVVGPWRGRAVRGPRSLEEFRAIDPGLNQAIQHMMDLPAEPVLEACMALLLDRASRTMETRG